ncbi:killer cell lectin-like receptor subfamily B member 1B allele C [Mauremys mutica]|uniref:killer cell lectin-like receptor subfamily B member 1B allele C n=1 Tax=Mauremys mutica TaxID=74926 RepID=UPI001D16576E|nr:killer cell lectin-like receptor subfamily B member 1B allele C [Mauremys mutica]
MAGEIVYADLNLPSGFPGSRTPLSAQPLGPPIPQWHRTALWVGWIGNIVLVIAVIALGIWVSHLVSEKGQTPAAPGSDGAGSRDTATPPGSDGAGSRDPSTAECSARLERVRSQLCPSAPPGPAGGSGCKLCPMDWQLRGDKCYWVSRGSKTWSESRTNCSVRGSQLLVIRDREELESLQDLTRGISEFWVGLSVPSPEKAWTWLDGSRLDQTQFPVSGPTEGNSCGAVKGNRIRSQSCSSAFQWICQRDAVPL